MGMGMSEGTGTGMSVGTDTGDAVDGNGDGMWK